MSFEIFLSVGMCNVKYGTYSIAHHPARNGEDKDFSSSQHNQEDILLLVLLKLRRAKLKNIQFLSVIFESRQES